uniref:Uncharacterized protein n=1 Tax=Glossina pallidipes TaxID=7398 RepID=A0A1A9Z4S6_GLOPL
MNLSVSERHACISNNYRTRVDNCPQKHEKMRNDNSADDKDSGLVCPESAVVGLRIMLYRRIISLFEVDSPILKRKVSSFTLLFSHSATFSFTTNLNIAVSSNVILSSSSPSSSSSSSSSPSPSSQLSFSLSSSSLSVKINPDQVFNDKENLVQGNTVPSSEAKLPEANISSTSGQSLGSFEIGTFTKVKASTPAKVESIVSGLPAKNWRISSGFILAVNRDCPVVLVKNVGPKCDACSYMRTPTGESLITEFRHLPVVESNWDLCVATPRGRDYAATNVQRTLDEIA